MDEQTMIQAVRQHAMRNYENGWDTLVECYSDGDVLEAIGDAKTIEQAIANAAAYLGVPVAAAGFVVKTHDTDGLLVRSFEDAEDAIAYYGEMVGGMLPCQPDVAALEGGMTYGAVSQFGTAVSIQRA